jgi:hypothetical protein
VGVRGGVCLGNSKWGGASLFRVVCAYEGMPVPGRTMSYMDSRVLWIAAMAACDGREDMGRCWLATRYMTTIHRVSKGVGVGVPVCWSGVRRVLASFRMV